MVASTHAVRVGDGTIGVAPRHSGVYTAGKITVAAANRSIGTTGGVIEASAHARPAPRSAVTAAAGNCGIGVVRCGARIVSGLVEIAAANCAEIIGHDVQVAVRAAACDGRSACACSDRIAAITADDVEGAECHAARAWLNTKDAQIVHTHFKAGVINGPQELGARGGGAGSTAVAIQIPGIGKRSSQGLPAC